MHQCKCETLIERFKLLLMILLFLLRYQEAYKLSLVLIGAFRKGQAFG